MAAAGSHYCTTATMGFEHTDSHNLGIVAYLGCRPPNSTPPGYYSASIEAAVHSRIDYLRVGTQGCCLLPVGSSYHPSSYHLSSSYSKRTFFYLSFYC